MSGSGGVRILAEAAQGFEGDPTLACMLVRAAAAGKADMLKFQLVVADELATTAYPYYSLFKQLEMPMSAWKRVASEADRFTLPVAFDVFGLDSLAMALELGAAAVKIHTTDFFNTTLFEESVSQSDRVFFSTGGITPDEIEELLQRYDRALQARLTMLFGFQAEPTRVGDNNLARLQALHERFPDLSLGFMDHSDGGADEAGWLGLLTLPYGITTIEKHITLDRSLKLEDHMSALDPTQFERYVRRIRLGEAALGSADLQPLEAERAYRSRAVKKVVAARRLAKSRILQCSDLKLLRASTDHQTQMFEQISDVVGRRLVSPLAAEQAVHPEHLA